MKHIVLSIDTADNTKLIVGLRRGEEKVEICEDRAGVRAQAILPLITNILQKNNVEFENLTAIEVNNGPGSFTGIRVGVTIANTLGTLLQIPVNGQKIGELVEPRYD